MSGDDVLFLQYTGLPETSPLVSLNPLSVNAYNGTTGVPMPSTDIKLLDDDGNEVEQGQSVEICIKGPQVMSGYSGLGQANAAAFTPDGYLTENRSRSAAWASPRRSARWRYGCCRTRLPW